MVWMGLKFVTRGDGRSLTCWVIILLWCGVLTPDFASAAPLEPPIPLRPSYDLHTGELNTEIVSSFQRLALHRVGGCPESTETSSALDSLWQPFKAEHCPPSQLTPAVITSEPSRVLSIGLKRARWRQAIQSQDHYTAHLISKDLLALHDPLRTHERIELSYAYDALAALDLGPLPSLHLPPSEALSTLNTLSQSAKGAQVRSLALQGIYLWNPLDEHRQAALTQLWTKEPQSTASKRLSSTPTQKDWLARGERAFKERDYQVTIHALQRYSPLSVRIENINALTPVEEGLGAAMIRRDPSIAQRAGLLIAISLMRLRIHDDEALRQLQIAHRGPDVDSRHSSVFYLANLLSRLERWDESVRHFKDYLRIGTSRHQKQEAGYQIGRVLHQAGRYPDSIREQKTFLSKQKKNREMYEWFLGWTYFRADRCDEAIEAWSPLAHHQNVIIGPKALYWTARCQALKGRVRQALRTLKKLNQEAPLGYYALLSQQLIAQLKDEPFSWKNPLRSDRESHWRHAAPPVPKRALRELKTSRSTASLADKITETLQMVSIGEEGLARVQSEEVCGQERSLRLIKKKIGARRAYQLCDQLRFYTGDHGARWKGQAKLRIAWKSGLHKRSARERVGAYPLAYYPLSAAAAQVENISPWWLMAHMLQESRYRPDVVSHAQAIGLLQILGRTGLRIHARIDWPKREFSSDQLYDPALSIRYAAWYLHHLSEDLGHPLLAIGAYNGGPMRFADHQDLFQDQPFDVMVEELGAHESRNYLRKVTDHFIRYLALYASDEEWKTWTERLAPPLTTPRPKRTVGF